VPASLNDKYITIWGWFVISELALAIAYLSIWSL